MIPSEGWQVFGDFAVPGAKEPVPAVIMLNRAAGSREAYRALAQHLLACGIASLRVDLRGHGESTNLGKFIPGQNVEILGPSESDVLAAVDFLEKDKRIDDQRIGIVGGSYSGEEMMEAGRVGEFVSAYVGLSPGSLSDESIDAIDAHRLPWLLVVSRHERHLKEVAQAFRERSRTGEYLEVGGAEHASGLFADHPDLNARLALWFQLKLAP